MRGNLTRAGVSVALVATILAAALLVGPWQASAGGQQTSGLDTSSRFVPDVVSQFAALALRPDGLAFDPAGSPDPSFCKHYQGMARKDGPDGTPYLFVSRSGNVPFGCVGDDDPGNLIVVRMGSRDTTGERLRSNRLRRNSAVGFDPPTLNTPPDPRDVVVTTITFDGGADWPAYGGTSGWPAYGHPGAMQLVGDVLAVALETPYEGAGQTAIAFLDVSNPETPRFLSAMSPGPVTDDFGAGTMGITPVRAATGACCDYLMVVTGKRNRLVKFFKSYSTVGAPTTNLTSSEVGWSLLGGYTEGRLESDGCLGADWPSGTGEGLQSLSFVRQGDLDGPLFLIGAHNNVPGGLGDDVLRLYRVEITPTCPFNQVSSKRVTSYPVGGLEDSANFATGSGVYVSPSSELIVYATDYANTGPWVPFVEYRHRNIVRPDSPTLRPTALIGGPFAVDEGSSVMLTGSGAPPLTQAWIQLFEDDGAGATIPKQLAGVFDSEWWLAVEYVDRDADDFGDLDALDHDSAFAFDLDFEENAGSWRWFAPVGCTISANDYPIQSDGFPGPDTVLLAGTGQVEEETDLDDINYDDDVGGITFGANCDSYYGAPIGLGWDLDTDSTFETNGTSVTFRAASLDGPTTATVGARAQHPTDPTPLGVGVPVPVPVEVRNVAPSISSAAVTDSLGRDLAGGAHVAIAGLPVQVDVQFTDPGRADTQVGHVSWGDSSADTTFDAFSHATNGAIGQLQDTHVYSAPGTHDIVVTITDDDGGATPVAFQVEVLSIEDAIESVASELTALIDSATNAGVKSALTAARDELLGNHGGTPPTNGALDKLEADDPVGAITKLRAAISQLLLAESRGAGDLSALKDLLGLAAEAIATTEYETAKTAVGTPSPGEEHALARIADLILAGHGQLQASRYLDACDSFRQATSKALDLSS
jgi:hypothetical protein